MLFQRDWAAGESCLVKDRCGLVWKHLSKPSGWHQWYHRSFCSSCQTLMAGNWDCFLPWIYNGSLSFRVLCCAYRQRVRSEVGQVHCCTCGSFFVISWRKHFSYLLPHTVSLPWEYWCLCTQDLTLHEVHELPPGKSFGMSNRNRFSVVFSTYLWAAVSSEGQSPAQKRAAISSKVPTLKRPKFHPCTFPSIFFLCCFFKTFSFSFQEWIVLWVGCGVCL